MAMTTDPLDDRPLVLTLRLDDATQEWFDRERATLFPPGRTAVGAHVTLFHALPASSRADVEAELARQQSRTPFEVLVGDPFPLGRGVAYALHSPELGALHRGLQDRWEPLLTAQDRQRFKAHVTVQNKVAPERARETLTRLRGEHQPFRATARGLQLWRYEGGPWALLRRFEFGAPPRDATE
jgi:2'-5' RNA ligase superfamily